MIKNDCQTYIIQYILVVRIISTYGIMSLLKGQSAIL